MTGRYAVDETNKCSRCHNDKCCTYTPDPLGAAPRSKSDFDHLLWQVSHQGVELYRDAGEWYLMIQGSCEHLQTGGGCAIYDVRPQICRDYSNEWCEYDESAEKGFELYFRNYAELLHYCKKRFKRWGQ